MRLTVIRSIGKRLKKNVNAQIATKENAYQLGPVYRMLFKSLNDFHGGFYCWDSTYKWQRPEPEYSDSIKNEWKRAFFFKGNAARQYWLPKSVLYVVC